MKTYQIMSFTIALFYQPLYAAIADKDPVAESQEVLTSAQVQHDLKNILYPQDYREFQKNIVEFSAAYQLKSGATYYEARQNSFNLSPTSAVVISPDGFYYVGYYSYANQKINYVTNDAKCKNDAHAAIKVLARQYPTDTKIIIHSSKTSKIGNHDCADVFGDATIKKHLATPASKISVRAAGNTSEMEYARSVAESIWGKATVQNWNMNDEMLEVIGIAANEIQKCSIRYNLVPKPVAYGSIPGILYFAKYAAQILKYHSGLSKSVTYKTCITVTASKYRSTAEMASMGF